MYPYNSVKLEQTKNRAIILDSIDDEDPAIDVKPYLEKSRDFHNLLDDLKKLQKQYSPKEGEPLARQAKAASLISAGKERISRYEKNVRRLMILRENLSFDSPLLLEVKQHIENVEFSRANNTLNTGALTTEQRVLLTAKSEKSIDPEELEIRLKTNATCFFLKALLHEVDTTNRKHSISIDFFKRSIESHPFPENLFEYCIRRQKTGAGTDIEPLYRQIITTKKYNTDRHAALALHNLAVMYKENREPQKAEEKFLEALAFYRNSEKISQGSFTPHIAATLANLAALCAQGRLPKDTENYEKAKKYCRESIDLFRICAKKNTREYMPTLAKCLTEYAKLHLDKKDINAAAACYNEAIPLYMTLRQTSKERYLPPLFEALLTSMKISIVSGKKQDAREDCSEALIICRELAQTNPMKYLPYLADILHQQAVIHTETGSPDLAEDEFHESISIYRRYRKLPYSKQPYTNSLARVLNDVGVLYMNTNKPDLAKREFSRSIALYQSLTSNPFALIEVCRVMINLSTFYLKLSPDREKSTEIAIKVVYIIRPFVSMADSVEAISREAEDILYNWGFPLNRCDEVVQNSKIVKSLKTAHPHLYH